MRGVGNQAGVLEQTDSRAGDERAGGPVVLPRARNLREHSFYYWRKRLRRKDDGAIRSARNQAGGRRQPPAMELVLSTGERLRIGDGVDAATLRLVLDAVRR